MENFHPFVRRRPVTEESVFYVNRRFTRRIVRLKNKGSGKSGFGFRGLQDQAKWKPGTVVIWDNQITAYVSM